MGDSSAGLIMCWWQGNKRALKKGGTLVQDKLTLLIISGMSKLLSNHNSVETFNGGEGGTLD